MENLVVLWKMYIYETYLLFIEYLNIGQDEVNIVALIQSSPTVGNAEVKILSDKESKY